MINESKILEPVIQQANKGCCFAWATGDANGDDAEEAGEVHGLRGDDDCAAKILQAKDHLIDLACPQVEVEERCLSEVGLAGNGRDEASAFEVEIVQRGPRN